MSGYYPDGVTQDSFDKEFNEMPNEDENIDFNLGELAYDAYIKAYSDRTKQYSRTMPSFAQMDLDIKVAWAKASEAVEVYIRAKDYMRLLNEVTGKT